MVPSTIRLSLHDFLYNQIKKINWTWLVKPMNTSITLQNKLMLESVCYMKTEDMSGTYHLEEYVILIRIQQYMFDYLSTVHNIFQFN